MESEREKEVFGLVCKRWLHLQSTDRKKLCARAGPHMLKKMASRFSRLAELDLFQSVSRSFYPGVSDANLSIVANGFTCLRLLNLHNCKDKEELSQILQFCAKPDEEIGAQEPEILGLFM